MSENIRLCDAQFIQDLADILTWAGEQGVSRHSRFQTYRKNIELLNQERTAEEISKLRKQLQREGRLTEVASSMSESIELLETIPALRNHGVTIPRTLVHKAFSGPIDAYRENASSNEARNAMFELTMAAMAARNGWNPDLTQRNPDVSFKFEGRLVKMECKRILSTSKFLHRLKEGTKQLGKIVDTDKGDVGIVALSLSKLSNPGHIYFTNEKPHEELSQDLTELCRANEQLFASLQTPAVAGFLFYASMVVQIPDTGFTVAKAGTFFPLKREEQAFLQSLAGACKV
jgi:hypothetical protein